MLNIKKLKLLYITFCFFSSAFWLHSCSQYGAEGFSQCPDSTPLPVFSEISDRVVSHHFEVDNTRSIERIIFEGGIIIELIQTGCSPMHQHFTFYWPTQTTVFTADDIATLAAEVMLWMGNLDPRLEGFRAWSSVFSELKGELQNGESFDVDNRYHASAHFMPGEVQNILYIELTML